MSVQGGMISGPFGYMDQPLRTRERAAVDVARAALRKIAQTEPLEVAQAMAVHALARMSIILGEREAR